MNIDVLQAWATICLVIAAICTTAFPLLYTFSPWYRSRLGRALMLQAIAFSLAMDITALGLLWQPGNIRVVFGIVVFVYTLIAIATAYLTYMLWLMNYKKQIPTEEIVNEQAR